MVTKSIKWKYLPKVLNLVVGGVVFVLTLIMGQTSRLYFSIYSNSKNNTISTKFSKLIKKAWLYTHFHFHLSVIPAINKAVTDEKAAEEKDLFNKIKMENTFCRKTEFQSRWWDTGDKIFNALLKTK